jgi:hypothetical protein
MSVTVTPSGTGADVTPAPRPVPGLRSVVARPVPTRRGVSGRPRQGGTRLKAPLGPAFVGGPAVPAVEEGVESVTVTISIAAGGPVRRNRVLAALRDLIEAAGPDAEIVGADLAVAVPHVVPAVAPVASAPSVVLDPLPRTVLLHGEPLELSRLEYDLLLFLAEHPRQVFSRTQLLAQVWGHTHTSSRTIDVHVSRLRTKLGIGPDVITTVYGMGYRLADDEPVTVVRR